MPTSKACHHACHSLKEVVSAEEWLLRVNLAAAYFLLAAYGMSDLVFMNVSARILGNHCQFLIHPYDMSAF